MAHEDLRSLADRVEKRLDAGRPDRHRARQRWFGELCTTGRYALPARVVRALRDELRRAGQDQDAGLFEPDVLGTHHYSVTADGDLVGPGSWPRAAPRLEAVLAIERAESGGKSAANGGSDGDGSSTISRAEARRQVSVSREYAAWSDAVRAKDVWERSQARRATVIADVFTADLFHSPIGAKLRKLAAEDPDPGVRELWSPAELARDYPAPKAPSTPPPKASTPAV